jgi:hypothetical protein
LRVACGSGNGCHEHRDSSEYQPSDIRKRVNRPACLIAATLPIDRCTVRPQTPHSICLSRSCH